jgi:hypothetical protein
MAASRRVRCVTALSPAVVQLVTGAQVGPAGWCGHRDPDQRRGTRGAALLAADRGLSGLEITGAGLEEAFLTLTSAPPPERSRGLMEVVR